MTDPTFIHTPDIPIHWEKKKDKENETERNENRKWNKLIGKMPKTGIPVHIEPKKRTPRAVFLAHEKALKHILRVHVLRLNSSSSKYAASKSLMGNNFGVFVRFIRMWVLYTACDDSHIVSIRTGLKSRLIWDWSAVIRTISFSKQQQSIRVKWEETSYV